MQIPVRIVLVETSHPGNIGAAARAMKTMGLSDLALVRPRVFPSEEASARASGATDVLQAARVCDTLVEAIADCSLVAGASARARSVEWPSVDPRHCAERLTSAAGAGERTALVFGPEHSGLTNEDLARCAVLVHIPAHPDYGSLNVAMAVQVLCYELRMAALAAGGGPAAPEEDRDARAGAAIVSGRPPGEAGRVPPATAAELDGFHAHLERLLEDVGFLRPDHPRQLKLKLRRIFQRARPDRNDINILRGMLAALETAARVGGSRGGEGEAPGQGGDRR